jgi:LysM repeat protein
MTDETTRRTDEVDAFDDDRARAVFADLVAHPPQPLEVPGFDPDAAPRGTGRLGRGVMATMPIVLAGAMTVSFNLTGPLEPVTASPKKAAKPQGALAPRPVAAAAPSAALEAPAVYTVRAGDTIASIAGTYGLSTAAVLTLNGLGWKSLIFPGQVLKLTQAAPASARSALDDAQRSLDGSGATRYRIVKGDTISRIAARFDVSTQALLTANGLGWSSIIYPGQTVTIPARGAETATPEIAPALEIETVAAVTTKNGAKAEKDDASNDAKKHKKQKSAGSKDAGGSRYTIRSGDTLSSIAARFGVSTQALLDANGLSWSSVIYAGRELVIPSGGGSSSGGSGGGSSNGGSGGKSSHGGTSTTDLSDEQAGHAALIIDVGRDLGVSDRGIVVALAAAMQESSLRNIDYGDRDSVGLFQQRPSAGWGSRSRLLDPVHATRLFFGGRSNPNAGLTRGLLDIPGWKSMTITQAAQAVQISAHPNAYAKWEDSAWEWLEQYG